MSFTVKYIDVSAPSSVVISDDVPSLNKIPYIERDRYFIPKISSLSLELSVINNDIVPELNDQIVVEDGAFEIWRGDITEINEVTGDSKYSIKAEHIIHNLENILINSSNLSFTSTDSEEFGEHADGRYYFAVYYLFERIFAAAGLVITTESRTKAADVIHSQYDFKMLRMDMNMLYSVNQDNALKLGYDVTKMITAWDLVKALCQFLQLYFTYADEEFTLHHESIEYNITVLDDDKYKYKPKTIYPKHSMITVNTAFSPTVSSYYWDEPQEITEYSGTYPIVGVANDVAKKMSLYNNLWFMIGHLMSDNIVLNPGFESWTLSKPDNWTDTDDCSQQSMTAHSGNSSVRINSNELHNRQIFQVLSSLPADELQYCLIIYVRGVDTGLDYKIDVDISDNGTDYVPLLNDSGATATSWVEHKYFFTKLEDYTYLRIMIGTVPGTGYLYFDDLDLRSDGYSTMLPDSDLADIANDIYDLDKTGYKQYEIECPHSYMGNTLPIKIEILPEKNLLSITQEYVL